MNTYTLSYPASSKKLVLPNLFRIKLKTLWALALIPILILLIVYVFQVIEMGEATYAIKLDQRKLAELSRENENLEIGFFQKSSLDNIENKICELGFEKVEKIHYIQILGSSIVKD